MRSSPAFLSLLLAVPPLGASAQGGYQQEHTGQGTFYEYGGGGNCSFPTPKATLLTAAMNTTDYNGAQACGGCLEVTNLDTSESVVVRIDDRCPGCAPGDVDLSEPAFARISPLEVGRIPIRWHYVSCAAGASAALVFKEGSSQWWAGMQVRGHRNPVASLAYRTAGTNDAYIDVPRELYNYFVTQAGMGPGPYDFRITDVFGQVIVAPDIALALDTRIKLGHQFPKVLPRPGQLDDEPALAGPASLDEIEGWLAGYCTQDDRSGCR